MSENKEPVNFVTEMYRSIDGKTYKGLGQSRTHNVEVPACHITIEGLNLPESLLEAVSQTLGDFRSRLLDSIRLDLRPCSDDGLTTGAGNHVAVFSLAPFVFRFECAAAFPAGEFHIDLAHGSTPTVDEQHPADSHSAGRTESVSGHVRHQSGCAMHDGPAGDEKRRDCGGFPSPTDAELRQHGCPALVEPRARTFLCQLPDSDLAAINAGVIPTPLMKLLGRVAYNEIERRRCA